jgi:NADH:ubiquinone oxidoreductase subunit 4 (subunit M)
MSGRELITVVPLVVLTIWIGVYPTYLLNKMTPSIEKLIEHVVGK